MNNFTQLSTDYQRIELALQFLQANHSRQPDLKEIASSVHLSEYHFQRLFTRWVGISPKRFLQYLTKENARQILEQSASLLEATYASGLSSPGRLHDLFVATEAVTPGEYKTHGADLTIRYGFHPTPFGECLLAVTTRGICSLSFVEQGDRATTLEDFQTRWNLAKLLFDPDGTAEIVQRIFSSPDQPSTSPLSLYLQGTNFQLKVWEALLRIPAGRLVTYEDLARWIGKPKAARAVGNAVALNPIAYLIPCHRVIRKLGDFGNYRYGPARKQALLGWELSRSYT